MTSGQKTDGPAGLLAVMAHPDDESLVAGGVLAKHAAAGARTTVVTATWAHGTQRARELAQAVRILGAGEPRLLGWADHRVPDSAPGRPRLCDAPLDEAVGQLVRILREVRPQVVVTHDAHGGLTGHPDHVHTHRVALLAVQAAALRHSYPDAGEPWQPHALYCATHPDSAVADLGPLLTRVGKSALSVPDEHVTATIDVRPWLTQKWSAVLAHASQLGRDRPLPSLLFRLSADARERILATEYYTRIALRPMSGTQHELTP
ncbi:PIG-L deacetylase family protein [Kitasatospora sp. NPDC127059]|uniref:PIG-L deacetylase family protein n=1 Tax=unclassified Kitasatospora TaxID=2633591 RepID=UPI00365D4404